MYAEIYWLGRLLLTSLTITSSKMNIVRPIYGLQPLLNREVLVFITGYKISQNITLNDEVFISISHKLVGGYEVELEVLSAFLDMV